MSPALKERAEAEAARQGMSFSEYVRIALDERLRHDEDRRLRHQP